MINFNGPVIEYSTPIAIVNQAFASFQSNIIDSSQSILVFIDRNSYRVDVFFSKNAFTINFNNETKTILTEGMFVDFYEVSNDIRKWFISRITPQNQLNDLLNYDIHNYFVSLYKNTNVKVTKNHNLTELKFYSESSDLPEVFTITQDYTGYNLFHSGSSSNCYIGYQLMSGEKPSTSIVQWINERLS